MEVELQKPNLISETPLVSIIIPTYNRAHLIGETLDSILAQTYVYWECIIVDDGSSDNTDEVIESYVAKDARFRFYHRPPARPKGANACRNYGFEMSQGEYVNWFDSDDLMEEIKLSTDIKLLTSSACDFSISQSEFFKAHKTENLGCWNKNLWSEDPLNDFIVKKIGWSLNAPLWKKSSLIKSVLKFDEELTNSQDYWYHIQAVNSTCKAVINPMVTSKIRIHEKRISHNKIKSLSKLLVYNKLFEKSFDKKLHKNTLVFLTTMQILNILNLYKHKEFLEGYTNSIKIIGLKNSLLIKVRILYFIVIGFNYKLTNTGYRLLFYKNDTLFND